MKLYQKILPWLTFIGGSFLTFLMLRPKLGNTYHVTAKVKNKKSTVTDNEVYTELNFEEEKKKRKLRNIFKRKNKRKWNGLLKTKKV